MRNLDLKKDYKNYSSIIENFNCTYTKNYNLYSILMYCIKSIKQKNKDNLKEGLKILFTTFTIHIDNIIYVLEYLKLKKCSSFNVYCELLFYFKNFKEGRINNNLEIL